MQYGLTKKELIAASNKIRNESRFQKLDFVQKAFIKKFTKKHKKDIKTFVILSIVETLIWLSLPLIIHLFLEKSFNLLNYKNFFSIGIISIVLIAGYLVNSYYRIYIGQNLSMTLINELREAWYMHFLKHSSAFINNFDGRKLMTKFLYHVQLLKMGLQNIINQGLQAILIYFAILIFSFLVNPKLFTVLLLSTPILVIIFLITEHIGKYYVAREQTFNSRIVSHLADSLMNFDLLKIQARENEKLKEMDNLIELDKHFRVRRQLWLQYSNRVVYGLILLFGILLYFIQIFWPFIEFDSLTNIASSGIILGFYSHLLFSAARSGIFFEAFRLGLYLSLPKFISGKKAQSVQKAPSWNDLRLNSQKIQFSSYGEKIKNFELNIKKNDRLSIYGKRNYGKTTLARIITGQKCSKSVNFKLDKFRISSKDWCSYKKDNYFISANPTFDTSIGEYLLGKRKASITRQDFDSIFTNLKQHKIFDFLLSHNDLLGKRIMTHDLSITEIILLQIAHCLLNKKSLIAIDHVCLDLEDNEKIMKALQILDKNSPKSAIIYFSSIKNNLITYDKTYQLSKNQFTTS